MIPQITGLGSSSLVDRIDVRWDSPDDDLWTDDQKQQLRRFRIFSSSAQDEGGDPESWPIANVGNLDNDFQFRPQSGGVLDVGTDYWIRVGAENNTGQIGLLSDAVTAKVLGTPSPGSGLPDFLAKLRAIGRFQLRLEPKIQDPENPE